MTISLTVAPDRSTAGDRRSLTVPADTLLPALVDRLVAMFGHAADRDSDFEVAGMRWSPRADPAPSGRFTVRPGVAAHSVRVVDLAARPGESFTWLPDAGPKYTCTVERVQSTPGGSTVVDVALSAVFHDLAVAARSCACGCGDVASPQESAPLRVERPVDPDELAAAAARTPLVSRVLALVEWLGAGRAVTPAGVLRPGEVADAVRTLGLDVPILPWWDGDATASGTDGVDDGPADDAPADDGPADDAPAATGARKRRDGGQPTLDLPGFEAPQPDRRPAGSARYDVRLHPVWSAAVAAGFVAVGASRAVGTDAARRWAVASDEQRVELWAVMLGGYLRGLGDALRGRRPGMLSSRAELLVDSVMFFQSLGADPIRMAALPLRLVDDLDSPLAALDDVRDAEWVADAWAVAGVVEDAEGLMDVDLPPEAVGLLQPPPDGVEEDAEATAGRELARRLVDGPAVTVTALGRFGLARLLRAHGWQVPVAGDRRAVPPEDLLDVLAGYAVEDAEVEAALWVEARGRDAAEQVRRAVLMASSPAPEAVGRRTALPALLVAAAPAVADLLPVFAADRWLAVAVAQARAQRGDGPPLDATQALWATVDVLWLLVDDPGVDALEAFEEAVHDLGVIALLESPQGRDAVRSLRHPHGAAVLRAALRWVDPGVRRVLRAEVDHLGSSSSRGSDRPARRAGKRRR